MKIKTKALDYESVTALPPKKHKKPRYCNGFWRFLINLIGSFDRKATDFTYSEIGTEKLKGKEPALYIMNHSSFIDLEIAGKILKNRRYNIVCTSDGFVGKELLMRLLGCIPTEKFVTDTRLVKDIIYTVKKNKPSVLIYPEASYSFDGTATPLPESFGKFVKLLGIPVVMIKTQGAFLRQPLYNMLKKRNVKTSATVEYVFSKEDTKNLSADEINGKLCKLFSYDHFRYQQEKGIRVTEPTRAEGLNKVLYKCAACKSEGEMISNGTKIMCTHCGKTWELDEFGFLKAEDGNDIINHIPDWYKWERECVRKEIEDGSYRLDTEVDIGMLVDNKAIYMIGEGRLTHTNEGFHLVGGDGKLDFSVKPQVLYGLYADYNWYELGDIICIGDTRALYYCFPKNCGDVVAKTRLATEEMYKLHSRKRAKQE